MKCKTCLEELENLWNGITNKSDLCCLNPYCEKYWLYQKDSTSYLVNQEC